MTLAKRLLIIGGGIAGLSAAWRIQQLGWDYTLLESQARLGGMVLTDCIEGCLAEAGPESFITRKPQLWQLAHELGLQAEILPVASEARGTAILHQGQIVPVPLGPAQLLGTPLLSWSGKLRLLAEPFVAAKTDGQDESLAAFATRRLGREASQYLVEPILAGIYSSDPHTQSVLTTASILPELEQQGSLLRGMLAQGRVRSRARKSGAVLPPRSFTFKRGAYTLVQALQSKLTGDVRTQTAVRMLEQIGTQWCAQLATGETIKADAVLIATQANVAAKLLNDCAPAAAALLRTIRHDGIGSLSLAYRQPDVPMRVTGLMIPRREGRRIDAITVRGAPRAKAGHVLVRVFFGGAAPDMLALDDPGLQTAVRNELGELLGITAEPLAASVRRWCDCFPKPMVGHPKLIAQIEAHLPLGLALAGNSYHGIGVPDVVHSAERAIAKLISYACYHEGHEEHEKAEKPSRSS